jgi:ATP-dependent RNA helicase DeaD
MRFNELNISPRIIASLDEIGYLEPTEVQEKAIPLIIQGEDVIVRSQTGTGKTAAFGIGLIDTISRDKSRKALILAPTRELAIQITNELRSIAANHNMHIFAVYGGQGMGSQIAHLRRGFEILIATPGRLLDHVKRGTVRLDSVNLVVLDEADRMLDIGFKPDIDRIMRLVGRERQMLLFSATVDARIKAITSSYMAEPVLVEIGPIGKVEKIEETFVQLKRDEKYQKLKEILVREPVSRTIVFVASKRGVEYVCRKLNQHNIEARFLHGGKSQNQREAVTRDFKEGRFRILIATDVAARGLHIEDVNHVINYDKADSAETHTHRIGRTGRMGNKGKATTFVELDPIEKKPRGGRGRGGGYHGHQSDRHGGNRGGNR